MENNGGQNPLGTAPHPVDVHPAQRWGALVGPALSCSHYLTTVGAWAREAGICETQMRLRCRLAGVKAKTSLDLIRVLRAVVLRGEEGGALQDYLDVGDARTLRRLFRRVGLSEAERLRPQDCVCQQRAIREPALVRELTRVLGTVTTRQQA